MTGVEVGSSLERIYHDQLQAVLDGSWKPGGVVEGTPKTGLRLAPWGPNVPADARAAGDAALAKIMAGENPFIGPIKDSSGNVRVKAGDQLDPAAIAWTWDWAVSNVVGG